MGTSHTCTYMYHTHGIPDSNHQLSNQILNREVAGEICIATEAPGVLVDGQGILPLVILEAIYSEKVIGITNYCNCEMNAGFFQYTIIKFAKCITCIYVHAQTLHKHNTQCT